MYFLVDRRVEIVEVPWYGATETVPVSEPDTYDSKLTAAWTLSLSVSTEGPASKLSTL